MKCFYDLTQDAVGTCKSCGRGLSQDYLVEFPSGLACKDRCEQDVSSLITLINNNVASTGTTNQILRKGPLAGYGTGIFLLLFGLVFTITGLNEPEMDFTIYLGIAFIGYGTWTLVRSYRYARIVENLPEPDREVK